MGDEIGIRADELARLLQRLGVTSCGNAVKLIRNGRELASGGAVAVVWANSVEPAPEAQRRTDPVVKPRSFSSWRSSSHFDRYVVPASPGRHVKTG